MHYCKKLKMLLLQNLRLHFYVLKLYLNKENNYIKVNDFFVFAYRSSLSFLLAFLSLANNLLISRLTASSRFCAILRRKKNFFYDLHSIQRKIFTYVLK